MSKTSSLPTTREIVQRDVSREKKEQSRRLRIKEAMLEQFATPVFVFNYFQSQAELKQRLNLANVEINKANERGGTAKGFYVLKGEKLEALQKHINNLYKAIEELENEK